MDPTAEFFRRIDWSRPATLPTHLKATVSIEVTSNGSVDSWLVTFDGGVIHVLPERHPADCTIRMSRSLFNQLVRGSVRGLPLVLANEMIVEGDFRVLPLLASVLPGPADAHDPRT